ncbi:exodeoxyribonuclease VII large subunit [Halocynthiibacter namhaensis]|uniref:exodeoxyribonuclease VII large subunit n=1 Tax=Halocynthiibacter namhaensis TaxID=1290553 RepID=UPI0005798F98|nr:exodeoxyribonuclease VII large subunit [Halocynthiibacter namhaensis]
MSDLFEEPAEAGNNTPEFSVSEIAGAVKKTIEGAFGRVRVRGEVGRVTLARSGHLYFDIKDDRSVIAGVSWKGQVSKLAVVPEEGMEIIASGKLTTFGSQSKYQLTVDAVEVAGEGALMALLEKRKKTLAAEGLFGPDRKKKIPFLPEVIGVITSPTGAVIRDILHRLADRFPRKVLVWPVVVQGDASAAQVARAIEGFNAMTPGGALPRPDLLIVARGGGSIEDLWGFNDETLARVAAASDIPLISAVGHETDTTLIDFVSDLRAPTPTAAAEHAVPVRAELLAWVQDQDARLTRALTQGLSRRGERLKDLSRALPDAENLVNTAQQRFDRWAEKLDPSLRQAVSEKRLQLEKTSGVLQPAALRGQIKSQKQRLEALSDRLSSAPDRGLGRKRQDFDGLSRRLRPTQVQTTQINGRRMAQTLFQRLSVAAVGQEQRRMQRLESLDRIRQTLGYKATLARGYAVVRGDGDLVTTQADASAAATLMIEFADGTLDVGEQSGSAGEPSRPTGGRKPKIIRSGVKDAAKDDGNQGSLF